MSAPDQQDPAGPNPPQRARASAEPITITQDQLDAVGRLVQAAVTVAGCRSVQRAKESLMDANSKPGNVRMTSLSNHLLDAAEACCPIVGWKLNRKEVAHG